MRFKWVPEPPATIAGLGAAQRAIPLVPASESTCLQRLVDRETPIETQDDANRWLTFLRAIEAIEETSSGYRRLRVDMTGDDLHRRLIKGVYGARELYDVLATADQPLDIETMLDRGAELSTWERHHQTDHREVHRRRQRRLADWFVLCGVVEKTATGYRLTENTRR